MPAVEQYARAHIVTDVDDREEGGAVRVTLRYDPEADPRAVRVELPPGPGTREWTFARSLLEKGLRAPARSGPVHVWPCGRVQTVVEFHCGQEQEQEGQDRGHGHGQDQGCSVVQFETRTLTRFLRRTYLAAAATESAVAGPAATGSATSGPAATPAHPVPG